jgi:hypothetical protein
MLGFLPCEPIANLAHFSCKVFSSRTNLAQF